jgi:hypothetical protein
MHDTKGPLALLMSNPAAAICWNAAGHPNIETESILS